MPWTLCTSGLAIIKAGAHADTSIHSGVNFDEISDVAEGLFEQETNTSWVANYSGLSTSIKNGISDGVSSKIAKMLISYNTTGYLTREADMLMNVNDDIEIKVIKTLNGKADTLKTP